MMNKNIKAVVAEFFQRFCCGPVISGYIQCFQSVKKYELEIENSHASCIQFEGILDIVNSGHILGRKPFI